MNIGPNEGQRLRPALQKFARSLITEARDLSGLSYVELDRHLAPPYVIWDGQVSRYMFKDRAPLASAIQGLENRTARLLQRKARRLCVRTPCWGSLGPPRPSRDLRTLEADHLSIAYEDGWPTYLDLLTPHHLADDPEARFKSFAWQWGILWGRTDFPWLAKMTRAFGWPSLESVDDALGFMTLLAEEKKALYDRAVGPRPWLIDENPWCHMTCPDLLHVNYLCADDVPPVLDEYQEEIPPWRLRYEAAEIGNGDMRYFFEDWAVLDGDPVRDETSSPQSFSEF